MYIYICIYTIYIYIYGSVLFVVRHKWGPHKTGTQPFQFATQIKMTTSVQVLREALAGPAILEMPCCFDALSAPAAGWAWARLDPATQRADGRCGVVATSDGLLQTAAAGEHTAASDYIDAAAHLDDAGPLVVDNKGVLSTARRNKC